jgi:hypothetical protein
VSKDREHLILAWLTFLMFYGVPAAVLIAWGLSYV